MQCLSHFIDLRFKQPDLALVGLPELAQTLDEGMLLPQITYNFLKFPLAAAGGGPVHNLLTIGILRLLSFLCPT